MVREKIVVGQTNTDQSDSVPAAIRRRGMSLQVMRQAASTRWLPVDAEVLDALLREPVEDDLPTPGEIAIDTAARFLRFLMEPDTVHEVRALKIAGEYGSRGRPYNAAGWFRDADQAAHSAVMIDKANPSGVYVTLNPCEPLLNNRSPDRLNEHQAQTTTDGDIVRRSRLLIDLDAERPAGIGSTDQQHDAAIETGKRLADHLAAEMGWPAPLIADSGNGCHLLYKIDLANDDDATALIKRVLAGCAAIVAEWGLINGQAIKVDTSVFNPARITKLIGTTARKGSDTQETPHRISQILVYPDTVALLPLDRLEAVAALAGDANPAPRPSRPATRQTRSEAADEQDYPLLDVAAWLTDRGKGFHVEAADDGDKKFVLDCCPFNDSHTGKDAAIFQAADGRLGFKCFHDSCSGYDWQACKIAIGAPDDRHYDRPRMERKQKAKTGDRSGEFNPTEFARSLVDSLTVDEAPKIFWRNGNWYRWRRDGTGARWEMTDKAHIANVVTRAMQAETGAAGTKSVADVVLNLAALVEMDDRRDLPFWTGENAPDGRFVAMRNGVLDLDAAMRGDADALRPHSPHWRSLSCLAYDYDPEATCEELSRMLLQNLDGDEERYAILQEFAGYILTAQGFNSQKFLILQGDGGTGKTSALKVFEQLIGEGNYSAVALQDFDKAFAVFGMYGKLANIAGDTKDATTTDEGVLKKLTGGDTISWEAKYKSPIAAPNTARLIFACNELPRWFDRTGAIKRRQLLVTFNRVVPPDERNPRYADGSYWMHAGLMPGVFNWALEGLRRLTANKGRFTHSDRAELDLAAHMLDVNPAQQYLAEFVEVSPQAETPVSHVYGDYRRWATDHGHKPLAANTFAKEIHRAFPDLPPIRQRRVSGMNGERARFYVGIRHVRTSARRVRTETEPAIASVF